MLNFLKSLLKRKPKINKVDINSRFQLVSRVGQGSMSNVWRAIDRATREANIHPARIFLVGDRSGGTEAFRIGCRHPHAFGGVVSLGGAFPLG